MYGKKENICTRRFAFFGSNRTQLDRVKVLNMDVFEIVV